ncbi:MAG: tetratricopeptide repeat protein [Anaerolineae bacterium]|nr:tetratricopeptide repeat protein [Anaerolineae bacterium]
MTTPLLSTKLYMPPIPPKVVARSRLLERLDEGVRLGHKLLLLSAPAGFGKTTLLSEWVSTFKPGVKSCWLTLDESDDDPTHFLAYLVAGLQTLEPGLGKNSAEFQQQSLQDTLAVLINQLVALSGKRGTPGSMAILILDDLHMVTSQVIYDGLTFLLDHMPAQMRLVIATRADPPVSLARLRARGQLTELRQSDLRFVLDEATEFLNRVKGLGLADEAVSALATRTEGWIAGLQMAALALEAMASRRQPAAGFIQAFAGSNRYVLDYLVEEVLQRQPPDVQQFLLRTSILEQLCGPLCDAILTSEERSLPGAQSPTPPAQPSISAANSQMMLDYLERANLFVVPLDDRREWYRYHRLFADLLQQRLQQSSPGLVPALQLRASVWCGQNGLETEAIDYALAAQDFQRAACLLEQAAQGILMRGEVTTFLHWMQALPDEWVRQYPSLCVFYAWALMMSGHPWAEVTALLEKATEGSQTVSAQAAALYSFVFLFQGDIARADELSRQALDNLPESDAFLRGFAIFCRAAVNFEKGNPETGRQMLDDLLRPDQETRNMAIGIMALCYLAESYMRQGQLLKAKSMYQQALDLATLPTGQRMPVAAVPLMGLGEMAREWNDFDAAMDYLEESLDLSKRWGEMSMLDGYISLALLKNAQGDVEGTQHFIRLAQKLAVQFDATQIDDWSVAMCQALLWLRQGKLEAVAQWAQERQVDNRLEPGPGDSEASYLDWHLRKYEQLVLARLLIIQGQPAGALAMLDQARVQMQQRGRVGRVIEIDTLRALAFQAQGQTDEAIASLERALTRAEPEGYVRLFVDEGEPIRILLQAARQKLRSAPSLVVYIDKLLLAFGEAAQQPAIATSATQSPAMFEPLSEREMQVLRLLTGSLSVTEIAETLFVSVSTTRSHVKSIYAKLDVHSRYEAVARAGELGIL